MRKHLLTLFLLTSLCSTTNAQSMNPGNYINGINTLFLKEYNYLKPLDMLQSAQHLFKNDEALRGAYCQLNAVYHSFVGDYAAALKDYNAMYPSSRTLQPDTIAKRKEAFAGFQPADAVRKIVSLAAQHRVVMINEAHHIPYHRLFTKSLLQELYQQGFRYLALETLDYHDKELNTRKYAAQGDGFYSAEPLFGDLIRTASRLGFQVVSYEDTTACSNNDCNKQREIAEAQNLMNILKRDTAAKILVHAGYDHIMEKPHGIKRMAMYFTEMSGINPLTIDQEKMCEQDTSANENTFYVAAQTLFNIDRPSVLVRQDSIWVEPRFAGHFDVEVFHPRFPQAYGRPGYFKLDTSRKPAALKPEAKYKNMLVQAYFKGEEQNGIPVDQMICDGKGPLYLMLPPGDFVIRYRDLQNRIVSTRSYHQGR